MKPLRQAVFLCLGIILLLAGAGPASSEQVSPIARKLEWCKAHKDNFDIVFVGSSRVFHGFSPKLFDQVINASGRHWRSFNLGMDKMGMAQSMKVIREFVATSPRNLQYVFFEMEAGTGMLPGGNRRPAPREGSSPSSDNHRLGGLGPDGDGFFPMARSMKPEMQPIYRQRLAATRENQVARQPNDGVRDQLARFAQELAANNIQVVFLVAPSLSPAHGSGVNAPSGSRLFSFDDLARYAPLYDEENRVDPEHLNARGAEIFTRTLAREFVSQLDSKSR